MFTVAVYVFTLYKRTSVGIHITARCVATVAEEGIDIHRNNWHLPYMTIEVIAMIDTSTCACRNTQHQTNWDGSKEKNVCLKEKGMIDIHRSLWQRKDPATNGSFQLRQYNRQVLNKAAFHANPTFTHYVNQMQNLHWNGTTWSYGKNSGQTRKGGWSNKGPVVNATGILVAISNNYGRKQCSSCSSSAFPRPPPWICFIDVTTPKANY